MESFLKKFFPEVYTKMKEDTSISNYCKFDSQLLTSFTSSLYVAGLVASFFASSVTRAFGRMPSILVGGAAFLAGATLGGAAFNVSMLILGRVLLGIGVGFANQVVYRIKLRYNSLDAVHYKCIIMISDHTIICCTFMYTITLTGDLIDGVASQNVTLVHS